MQQIHPVEYESLLSKVKGSLHLDMIERKVPLESSKRSLGGSSLSCHKLRTPNDSFRGKMTNFVRHLLFWYWLDLFEEKYFRIMDSSKLCIYIDQISGFDFGVRMLL